MVSRYLASATWCRNSVPWRHYNETLQLLRYGNISGRRQRMWYTSQSTSWTSLVTYSTPSPRITTQKSLWNDHQKFCQENRISKRPVTSLIFGRAKEHKFQHPWHDPKFMQESSPEEVETWLLSLIQDARQDADDKGIPTNKDSSHNQIVFFDKGFSVDAIAYLRILEAYARSKSADSPQKAEYWIGVLERHHSAALELFSATYGIDSDGGTVDERKPDAADGSLPESPFEASVKRNQASVDFAESSREKSSSTPTSRNATPSNIQREHDAAIVRNLQPTVECYNAIIETWGNDKDLISVVRSRRWLSKLEDEAKKSTSILHSPLGPNARSYDLYLHSCSRGLGKQHKLHKERAEEAEQILYYRLSSDASLAIRPTTESFNYVLRAWTRCRKETTVPEKVMHFVLMMEKIQKDIIIAEEQGVDMDGEDWSWKRKLAPDTKTYTMAIDGWIIKAGLKADKWRSNQRNAGRQRAKNGSMPIIDDVDDDGTKQMETAETILKYIADLQYTGLSDVRATVIGYNTLLSGWARIANELRPDVPLKSEKLLHDMIALAKQGNENAAPDVTSFNAVIKAWGRIKRANSADRCEYWLRKMRDENHPTNSGAEKSFIAKPNTATYNLCMDAHFQLSDAPRVQDMLIEMDATNGLIPPNNESFSKVIRAWLDDELNSELGLPGSSLENAWGWLDELLQREKEGDNELGPAPELFSAILKTAAMTNAHGENLLTIGQWTFQAYKGSRFLIDHLPYTWLLQIILKVLSSRDNDKRREELITSIFEQCCKDGLLSSHFVRKLYDGPFYNEGWTKIESRRIREELFGDPPFPNAWSRNLKDQRHRP